MTTQASEDKNAQEEKCLRIGSQAELEEFWRQILLDFVDVVDPDSGFLIDLYSGGELLTDTDFESLVTGKDRVNTKHRARRLWCILSTYPLRVFNLKLAPKLMSMYSRIIPERFLTTPANGSVTGEANPEEQCLRHDIQTLVRLERLADLLCRHGCLDLHEYRKLVTKTSRNVDETWSLLFDALAQCPAEMLTNLESPLRKLMNRYHVTCPDNVVDIQSRGFPCECDHPQACPPTTKIDTKTKVLSWRERALSTVHPSSSGSSVTNVDVSNSSLSSSLRPVSASSERSDIMVTKTLSESDSHFDGMSRIRAGFTPSDKLTRKSISEVNISSDSSLLRIPSAKASSADYLGKSSSNDDEYMPLNKSKLHGDTTYITVEHNVSEIPQCAGQGQINKKSLSEIEEQEGDVDFPESMELVTSSDGNYKTSKTATCCLEVISRLALKAASDTALQVDEVHALLDHGPRADDAATVTTVENCLDRLVLYYGNHSFFSAFRRELHLVKNHLQILRLCTDKYIFRKRRFPPILKQLFEVFSHWWVFWLALVISWIVMTLKVGPPIEGETFFSLLYMWLVILSVLGFVLVVVLIVILFIVFPMLCCKILCARFVTSVWVLRKMFKAKPVVEVLSDMQEGETYQTTSD